MNKLSKREVVLIIVLVNLIGYYILFNVIGLAISNKNKDKLEIYEDLKAQQEILEIESLKDQINTQNLENLNNQNNEIKNKLFSNTNSENIHYFLTQVAEKSDIVLSSVSIKKAIVQEDIEATTLADTITQETTIQQVNTENSQEDNGNSQDTISSKIEGDIYNIQLEITGSYENKIKFINNLEKYEKSIAITDFFTSFQGEITTSKLSMNIYTINKQEQDKELIIK